MSTCSYLKVTQEKNLHIYKEALHDLTLLDTQKQEEGAAEAAGGLAANGQLVTAPK